MNEPTRCVLCDQWNACGVAAGKTSCWCFSTPVPQGLLDRVPADQRNATCICQACVSSYLREQDHHDRNGGKPDDRDEAKRPHEV
ncbi:MAG: cysteine-rich CWC family protein [Vicinamibacterales bacterium]